MPAAAVVTYTVVHKFHEFSGTSTAAEVRAVVSDAGVKVQARVPVASFSSGNANRDSNAQAVLDAHRIPWVSLRGVAPTCDPTLAPCTLDLDAVVDLHGVSRSYAITVTVAPLDNGRLRASFAFPVTLTDHRVELPSLLFIPIDDRMVVRGQVDMEPAR